MFIAVIGRRLRPGATVDLPGRAARDEAGGA